MDSTDQRNYAGFGLMDYAARFYSPAWGRFIQPDTVIPGLTNSQAWNRFSYVNNNPVLYNDPTGHYIPYEVCEQLGSDYGACGQIYDSPESRQSISAKDVESEIIESTLGNANGIGEMLLSPGHISDIFYPFVALQGVDNIPTNGVFTKAKLLDASDIRKFGVALDSIPAALTNLVGYLLQLGPAQVENISDGEPFSNYVADFIVDSTGLGISEQVGGYMGGGALAATGNPLAGAGFLVFGDFSSGIGWEAFVNNNKVREKTEARINEITLGVAEHLCSSFENQPVIQPVQTAPPYPNIAVTPHP